MSRWSEFLAGVRRDPVAPPDMILTGQMAWDTGFVWTGNPHCPVCRPDRPRRRRRSHYCCVCDRMDPSAEAVLALANRFRPVPPPDPPPPDTTEKPPPRPTTRAQAKRLALAQQRQRPTRRERRARQFAKKDRS